MLNSSSIPESHNPVLPTPGSPEELRKAEAQITAWAENLLSTPENESPLAGVERVKDMKGDVDGWYMRLEGEQKRYFSLLLELGQRTLRYESYFMPTPLENSEKVYAYLMGKNYTANGVSFSVGPESAIYLAGRVSLGEINEIELDRILGTVYTYTESHFRPAMKLGFGEKFKG